MSALHWSRWANAPYIPPSSVDFVFSSSRVASEVEQFVLEFGLVPEGYAADVEHSLRLQQLCNRAVDACRKEAEEYRDYFVNPRHRDAVIVGCFANQLELPF